MTSLVVRGPLDREHWVKPENFDRIFTRQAPPEDEQERFEYAREVLGRFATRGKFVVGSMTKPPVHWRKSPQEYINSPTRLLNKGSAGR